MTEPNNPLFDDEKEFLERKKLEYERALRGDVEEIKEQTIHVSKIALVGAGIASGIWLLTKAFGGRKAKKKHKKSKHKPSSFEDYAGFDSYEDYDDEDHGQELDSLAMTYNSPEYAYDHADRFGEGDGFYQEGNGTDYFQDQDEEGDLDADADIDDNGLSDYPDFPAHSSPQHGTDADAETDLDTIYGSHAEVYYTDQDLGEKGELANTFASASSYQALPYDDSRRLPESNSFADTEEAEPDETTPASVELAAETPEPKKAWLVPAVMAFAKTATGKVIVAQAAAVAMAFVTSKVKDILPGSEAKADKNADLAHSSALAGAPPAAWPATTAAQDVSAAAKHDDTTISYREPLA